MGSAEFGCSCLSSTLRRKAGLALAFIVFGSIAGASGVVVQMAGHEPNVGGRSVIAIPLNPNAALSATISPAPPAVSAPDNRQDSAPPSNSAQATPVDATTTATASTTTAATELAPQPVTASEKSQKAAPSQNRRDYDASAWCQHSDYGRGRGYGRDYAPSW